MMNLNIGANKSPPTYVSLHWPAGSLFVIYIVINWEFKAILYLSNIYPVTNRAYGISVNLH